MTKKWWKCASWWMMTSTKPFQGTTSSRMERNQSCSFRVNLKPTLLSTPPIFMRSKSSDLRRCSSSSRFMNQVTLRRSNQSSSSSSNLSQKEKTSLLSCLETAIASRVSLSNKSLPSKMWCSLTLEDQTFWYLKSSLNQICNSSLSTCQACNSFKISSSKLILQYNLLSSNSQSLLTLLPSWRKSWATWTRWMKWMQATTPKWAREEPSSTSSTQMRSNPSWTQCSTLTWRACQTWWEEE